MSRSRVLLLALFASSLVVSASLPSISAYALSSASTTGSWDPTFGCVGRAATSLPVQAIHLVGGTMQPDGRMVVVGSAQVGSVNWDPVIVRFLPDGALDPGFGNAGMVDTVLPGETYSGLRDVVVQPDGAIVAVGWTGAGTSNDDLLLIRFNADGSLDQSFGSGGIVATPVSGGADGEAVALTSSDEIVIAGETNTSVVVARYLPGGSLDGSFAASGVDVLSFELRSEAEDLALQSDGKIVIAGNASNGSSSNFGGALVARLMPDGSLDSSFGQGGYTVTGEGGSDPYHSANARRVAVLSNGEILTAGSSGDYPNGAFVLTRFQASGSLDPTFGSAGIVSVLQDHRAEVLDLSVLPGGTIAATGDARYPSTDSPSLFVARLHPNGSLMTSFAHGGVAHTKFQDITTGVVVAVRSDDRVLGVGSTYNGESLVVMAQFDPTGDGGHCADAQIKVGGYRFQGNGVYDHDGDGQYALVKVRRGHSAVFTIRAQNDGASPTVMVIKGPYGPSGFTDTYLIDGVNQSEKVSNGYVTQPIQPGAWLDVVMKIHVSRTVPVGTVSPQLMRVISYYTPTIYDAVRPTVEVT